MRLAVFSTNLSFFEPLAEAFKKRGHELLIFDNDLRDFDRGALMARLFANIDAAFIEFCQTPMREVMKLAKAHKRVVIVARMHRIEIYNDITEDRNFDWGRVDLLFASADHVLDRFMQKRTGLSKPKALIMAPTNIVDPTAFKFVKRNWTGSLRLCMLGNFVPKKRQYSLIQCMYDMKKEFGDQFVLDIVGNAGKWSGYGNPEYYQNCLDLIEDLKLKDVVTVYDGIPHKEVPQLLSREHVIISNSNEEGTHVAIAEGAMTGCIPFVNAWRGAEKVYPEEVAWLFRSPGEFHDLCRRLYTCVQQQEQEELSARIAEQAASRYGRMDLYSKMVEEMENLVKRKQANPA